MQTATPGDWAEGLYLTVTGLSKDQRMQARDVVEAAGGRYSPNFSKRCTHLVVSTEQNDVTKLKLYLAGINKDKWHAQAVRFEWLLECANQSRQVSEDAFVVDTPKHEDVSTLQQRLQEVAMPTTSEEKAGATPSDAGSMSGVNKRCAPELEAHNNITMRSAPRQSSKRHKQATPTIPQPQQHASQAHKTTVANTMESHSTVGSVAAAMPQQAPQQAPQQQVTQPTRTAWPLALRPPQQHGNGWTKPLSWPPQQQLPLPPQAAVTDGSLSSRQIAAVESVANQPLAVSLPGNAPQARLLHSMQDMGNRVELQSSTAGCRGEQQVASVSASNLAAKLHCMQADAREKARHQHKPRGLAATEAPGVAYDASGRGLVAQAQPSASGIAPQATNATAGASGSVDSSTANRQAAVRHPSWRQPFPNAARMACTDSAGSLTAGRQAAACSEVEPQDSTDLQPRRHTRPKTEKDAAAAAAAAADEFASGSLSLETESLVAKLRALSQGRGDGAPAKGSKPDAQQHQRLPFTSRTTNSRQPPDRLKPKPPASHPAPKRSKQTEVQPMSSVVAGGSTAGAAADPVHHQRQQPDRRIKLMEPVHARTALGSVPSPQHHTHRVRSNTGSPSGGGKHHSGHSSVGDPIHLGSQEATAPASSMPAAPVSKAEAAANPRQQHPEVSVQHRLGKATPVKKTFTPRPSRFRLEAERPSVTPPDKSSGLEKVLFRSPAKAGKAPRQAQQLPCEDAIDCIGPGSSHQDVQPMDADCAQAAPQLQNEAQPPRPTPEAGDDGCEMVTPANQLHGGGQAVAHGVFAHMRVILDPELAAEESDRMRGAVETGGGQIVGGAYLGSGATHVVCHPQAAVKWLAMGLSIVSPPWLLRSLAQGTPDRCLHMSLDASRHLPSSVQPPSAHSRQAERSIPAIPADGAAFPEDFSDRQARQTFVEQLQNQEVHPQWGLAQQALQTPQTMLDDMLWCVTDSPEQARLDALSAATQHTLQSCDEDVEMAECSGVLSATQEACQAELELAEAMCAPTSSAETSAAAAASEELGGQPGRQLQEADWQEVVYKAPVLTLLLPLDSVGACGHSSRSLHIPPQGCTRHRLLHSIHSFYQELLSVSEQLQMMQSSATAANIVKEVFVEGAPVKRMALLYAKVNLEGLERVSRDLTGTIYELKLSC